jgi:hypothetical protein
MSKFYEERERAAQEIMDAGEKKYAEFETWAKKQKSPPYYLELNPYRCNEGNRWYRTERTQHTAEGFIAAMALVRSEVPA